MFKCKICNKEFSEDWRKDEGVKKRAPVPEFCSRSCSNTRHPSKETKKRISASNRNFTSLKYKASVDRKREKARERQLKLRCVFCGEGVPSPRKLTCSKECQNNLSSQTMKEYLERHPDKVPYLLYHDSKGPSYPEKYWLELLKLRSIPLKYHKQIGRYQLDFYSEEKKIDLEIDGDQHYKDIRMVESDKRRTKYLEKLGWKIIRVRWSDWQKESKENQDIFLEKLGSLT